MSLSEKIGLRILKMLPWKKKPYDDDEIIMYGFLILGFLIGMAMVTLFGVASLFSSKSEPSELAPAMIRLEQKIKELKGLSSQNEYQTFP